MNMICGFMQNILSCLHFYLFCHHNINFDFQGIPSVIVLDAKTGHFITDNGREDVMQSGISDDSKKAVIESWIAKEAVPIDQAVFGGESGSENLLVKLIKFLATKPAYIFGLLYFVKKFMLYLEEMGKGEIEDQKEL